jgi:cold shock CspA family protein
MAASGLAGIVKSYNGIKGYGFISGSALPQADVLFGKESLPDDVREVQGKFLEGRQVLFNAEQGTDGRYKATAITLPFVEGKQLAGKIKFYNPAKGYGFITSSSLTQDVHFKISDLPPVVPGLSVKDELVVFDVQVEPDGKLQVGKMMFQSKKIAFRLQGMGEMGMLGGMMGGMMGPGMMGGGMMGAAMLGGGMMGGGMVGMSKPKPAMMGMSGIMTGNVKSYSEKNGYGFITSPACPVDIKFGNQDLGVPTIAPGTTVSFSCIQDKMGRFEAKHVTPVGADMTMPGSMHIAAMKRPATAMMGGMTNMMALSGGMGMGSAAKMQKTETGTGQFVTGVIKSLNTKGFGFITSPAVAGDVFFMKSALPQAAQILGDALVTQTVLFEIAHTQEGKIRAQNITFP